MVSHKPWDETLALDIITQHTKGDGSLLPILHAIQESFGFIHEAATSLIAHHLNLSRAEVHGVITFYHDFRRKPPGRHVLKLCRAEACQAAGSDRLIQQAEDFLNTAMGGTTNNQSVTLEAVYCLGLCAIAPSAMLDGQPYARLNEARLKALLKDIQQ